jgi:DNA invertase Pin-like site-specific DNA recombinase
MQPRQLTWTQCRAISVLSTSGKRRVMKAYSYIRWSHAGQADGDTLRRQSEAAQRYADEQRLELVDRCMTDAGISAFKGDNVRKGALGQFLRAVDDEEIETPCQLLVESWDRVVRSKPWDALPVLQQIINAGVTVTTLFDKRSYSAEDMRANPFRIVESLLFLIRANEESETKSRRVADAWKARKAKAASTGFVIAETTPGWIRTVGKLGDPDRRFELIPERATIVQHIVSLALSGMGMAKIAETLNREGVEAFGGGAQWYDDAIRRVLSNGAIAGVFEGRDGYYPAAVTLDQWRDVQALRAGRRLPQHRVGTDLVNPLAGLARCSECGATMTRKTYGSGPKVARPKLICSAAKTGKVDHPYRAVNLESVVGCLLNALPQMLAEGPTGDSEIDREVDRLRGELAGLDAELERVIEAIRRHGHSVALREALTALEQEKRAAELKIGEATRRATSLMSAATERRREELFDAIADGADAQRLNVKLRAVFERIEVDPASGRMRLVWLDGSEAGMVVFQMAGEGASA